MIFWKKFALFVVCMVLSEVSWAEDRLPPLSASDRILILAPHPDDETIGAAGVIQDAIRQRIPVRIVYLTNGDDNEVSFMVYKKRPVLTRQGLLKMGRLRQQEARTAMRSLGLADDQLTFLGYPDGGTLTMFIQHWGEAAAFESHLTRSRAVPYADAPSYHAPHKGESVLNDLKAVIFDFHPTKIFVTMPADHNSDHQAFYLFLRVALMDLAPQMNGVQVMTFMVHALRWPLPGGLKPDQPLNPPPSMKGSFIQWMVYPLGLEAVEKKRAAVDVYRTQIEYRPKYLYSFVRTNELFGMYPDIFLKSSGGEVNWSGSQWMQRVVPVVADKKQKTILQSVAYAIDGDNLLIRVKVDPWTSVFAKTDVYVMPYAHGRDFGLMPKLKIHIDFNAFVNVYDQSKKIGIDGFSYEFLKKEAAFVFKIPLGFLQDPDHLITSARAQVVGWPMEFTPWRVVRIEGDF